jgi:NDP-sugar pyrophosphorylase family protein
MNNISHAMIFAAGFGSRLMPLTRDLPKPLMEYAAKPIIFHLIDGLADLGIKHIIINLHYLADKLKKTIEKSDFKCKISFSYEKELLGTAGGISKAINEFGLGGNKMLALHGDIFCDLSVLKDLRHNHFCELVIAQNHEVSGYEGKVSVNQRSEILELGRFFRAEGLAVHSGFFTGIHYFSEEAVDLLAQNRMRCLVSEIYPLWLKQKRQIKGLVLDIPYEDLGDSERLFQTNMKILENLSQASSLGLLPNFAALPGQNSVFCAQGVKIDKTVHFSGPVIIGPKAVIKENAVLSHAILGSRCLVSPGAFVNNTVLMSDSRVEKDERLNDMIVHPSTRLLVRSYSKIL